MSEVAAQEADKALNTPHTVMVGAPLLRPGLTISAVCSERYAVLVAKKLIAIAREINQ